MKFEDGILRDGDLVALREVIKEPLKFLNTFEGDGLVELRIRGVEIIAVSAVEAGQFGLFTAGHPLVIRLEIDGCIEVIALLVIRHSQHIERLSAIGTAAPRGDDTFAQRGRLHVLLLVDKLFGILELELRVVALQYFVVIAAGRHDTGQQQKA